MKVQPVTTIQPQVRKPASKCIQQCKADPTRKHCVGCLRTMEEIIAAGMAAKNGNGC